MKDSIGEVLIDIVNTITQDWMQIRLKELGFFKTGIINTSDLNPEVKEKLEKKGIIIDSNTDSTIILTALSYYLHEKDDLSTSDSPHGLIAPFARRNYYKYTVLQLKQIVREIGEITGLGKRDIRIFSNSTLSEKPLAETSGIGFYGKNSLIYTQENGSLFVIGGFILPFPLDYRC